jgi:glycosyltransferase involved in cell wall biosynthesis
MDTVVLVSNTGALPEVCGKAAFYVNPYSIKDIADGILEVVLNEKLRKELKASYNAILRKFSFDSFKTRVSSFIQRLY